jgi:hypothetical protein
MKFHLADTTGLNTITGHGADHVLVNGTRHAQPLLVGPDVGPLAIDFQMKQDFASAAFSARELISLEVNCAKVVWLKKAFAVQGRGAKDIFG